MSDTTKAPANRKDKWTVNQWFWGTLRVSNGLPLLFWSKRDAQQHLEDGERLVRVFVAGVER